MNLIAIIFSTFLFGVVLVVGVPQKPNGHVFKTLRSSNPDWWETAVIYQIYPRSFKDSNNDGIGDLQGIIQKLDHIKDMDVDAIWLSPIFKSPQVDTGYDISDYRDIDPVYGTLDDLRELLDKAHELNIKVLLDYVPNHTSDQHPWFQASLKGYSTYADYYVWRNGTKIPEGITSPNNWLSYFKDSAWEWSEERQQYYLHQFSIAQPDLNYRNPAVVEEMKDVLRYWLNFGVDGFRVSAAGALFEDNMFRDEPKSGSSGVNPNDHEYLDHIYTVDQPETFDMIYQWRELLDEFNKNNETNNTRIMITEGNADPETFHLFYQSEDHLRAGAHFTFNFITFVAYLHKHFAIYNLISYINTWLQYMPLHHTDNWVVSLMYNGDAGHSPRNEAVLGSHDFQRISTRLGVEHNDFFNMIAALLPGVLVTYQGEEIGQENGEVTCEEGTDPRAIKNCSTFAEVSRDFARTPFQWDNSVNAGFNTGAKTWLPVSDKYVETNLADQSDPEINSHYNIYKQMVKLRKEFKTSSVVGVIGGMDSPRVFYTRRLTDNANYILYYNLAQGEALLEKPFCTDCLTVLVRNAISEYTPGDKLNVSRPLKSYEAVVCVVGRL